jgi:hypothetical protein
MMKIGPVVAAAAVFAIASPVCAQDAVQWRVEDGGNGHWYEGLRYSAQGVSWSRAREDAILLGAELVSFVSAAETSWVFSSVVSHELMWNIDCGPWVGGYQLPESAEPSGGWTWVDGSPASNTFDWAVGQPDDARNCGGNNNRLHYWRQGSLLPRNTIADAPDAASFTCDQGYVGTFRTAVIEWSADCNGDGIVDYGQIRDGTFPDVNTNGVPDCCEPGESCTPCPGDVTNGGTVDAADLSILLAAWGTNGQGEFDTDLNSDGLVDGGDLALVLGGWGACP